MNDREFLIWIHARLQYISCKPPFCNYMGRLRGIIKNTDENATSAPFGNSIKDVVEYSLK